MSLEMQGSAFVILSMRYSYVIIHELFPFPAFDCLKIVYPHRIFKKYNIKLCINLSFVLVSSIAEVCFFFFSFFVALNVVLETEWGMSLSMSLS